MAHVQGVARERAAEAQRSQRISRQVKREEVRQSQAPRPQPNRRASPRENVQVRENIKSERQQESRRPQQPVGGTERTGHNIDIIG